MILQARRCKRKRGSRTLYSAKDISLLCMAWECARHVMIVINASSRQKRHMLIEWRARRGQSSFSNQRNGRSFHIFILPVSLTMEKVHDKPCDLSGWGLHHIMQNWISWQEFSRLNFKTSKPIVCADCAISIRDFHPIFKKEALMGKDNWFWCSTMTCDPLWLNQICPQGASRRRARRRTRSAATRSFSRAPAASGASAR